MKKIFLLLFITFGFYSFAESTQDKKIENIQSDGLAVKLSDGSEWEITYFGGIWKLFGWGWTEQNRVSHWASGDAIEILYPASGNYIDFILVIHNLSKKEHALAHLKSPPSLEWSDCLWVMDFDEKTNRLTLSDGTVWFKTKADMYGAFFKERESMDAKWEVGDMLTLVRGEGWLNSHEFYLWNHLTCEMPCIKPFKELKEKHL